MYLNFTENLLRDAGIRPGMKVLDIGCGLGEVSFLVADIVTDTGEVVAVDINPQAIAKAQADPRKRPNIRFIQSDLSALPLLTEQFDAVVGRRVLMYLADPVQVMAQIAKLVKPAGLFVFQENDSTLGRQGTIAMPLHDKVVNWMWKTVEGEGADIRMGFNLSRKMQRAGIAVDCVRAEPVIQGQGGHNTLAFIVRAILHRILEQGVASEEEIDIDTLEQRLAAERPEGAIYITDTTFGVYGHKVSR